MYDVWNRKKIGELHIPTFFNGSEYVTKFVKGHEYYHRMMYLYDRYRYCRYVPYMRFEDNTVYVKNCGIPLSSLKRLTLEEKQIVAYQIMDFVSFMFNNGLCHRDLHLDNICWDGNQIWIIDWESIYSYKFDNIKDHPDYQLAFMSGKDSIYNFVKPVQIDLDSLPFS